MICAFDQEFYKKVNILKLVMSGTSSKEVSEIYCISQARVSQILRETIGLLCPEIEIKRVNKKFIDENYYTVKARIKCWENKHV